MKGVYFLKKAKKPISLLLAFLIAVSLILPSVPAARADKPPGETAGEVTPEVTIPEITVPETTTPTEPEPTETEPVPETTVPTEPMPTEPEVTEPPIPETSAPTEPEMTEPMVPEATVPETTIPETVPATTAPEETTVPTEPPFISPTPLLEQLPADFQSKVQVPDGMQHNRVLDALTELGYPVEQLQNAGVLYDYNYLSIMLPEAYRTGIPYGGGSTGLESVDHFRTNGLVCASFLSYYLWNFLPQQGINTQMLTESFTGSYASVPEIRGVLEAASKNYAYYDTVNESELRVIKWEVTALSEAKPGDLLFYGDEHCAVYLGTADLVDSFTGEVLEPNAIFLAHCGTDRGVEITTNSELENSGLQLTTVYSLEWTEDIAYFIPSSPDPSDRANTVVMAKRHFFSLGGDVDYKYYVWKGYMHRVGSGRWYVNECAYFELANGAIAYCLEPWVTSGAAGQHYDEIPDPWNPDRYNDSSVGDQAAILGPDARKKQAIQKILACGVHNTSQNATEAEKRATALFIWDAVCGYWDGNIANQSTSATGRYDDTGASIDNPPFYRSTWGYDNATKAAYEAISTRIKGGQKYPSFANLSSSSLGVANTFTLVKNPSNGMYEASKTDTNNILGDYNFTISPISGLTISRSGNVLKISATGAAASEVYRRKGVVASATGHFYNFGGQNMNMTVWGDIWDSSVQKFISLVNFSMKPLPCYIKIDAKVDTAVPFTLKKTMKGDPDIIAQLQGNACYSLEGAWYDVHKGGVWQETISTNAKGEATSAKKYDNGTVLTLTEVKAPPGFKLDPTPHTITIRSGQANVVYVADEPVFDPDVLRFEKKDPNTGLSVPQGNAKFVGAVFKWEYFDNQKWEGTPKRTWFFETKSVGSTTAGQHYYDPSYLAGGYNSDSLYFIRKNGLEIYQPPIGSVRITEVKAPAGYGQIPELKANITQPSNGGAARFVWTPESAAIVQSKDGKYLFPEPQDPSTYASISIQKQDADTGGAAPNGANFAGCEFTVYNRSANPVKIGSFPTAAPGEACYVLTLDAAGHAATGAEFPLGKYELKETKGNAYYQCNTGWSQTFEVTMGGNTEFSFTVANTPVKGHIQLQKINSETGAGLTGAVFQVTHSDGKTSYMTEQPGGIHRIENLRYGSYKVQEVKAPEGYLLDPTVYTVNITENGKTYVVQTAGFNGIANEPIRGHFRVTKVETGTTTLLQGAEYTVKAPDGSLIGVYTTDETGSFEVRDLLYGKGYTYQETKAPAGYLIDPTVYTFDITEDDRTYTYTRENAPQPGSISIQKVDTHGNPMPGVTFKLEYSLDDGGTWLPVTSRATDALLTPGTSSTPNIVDGALTTDAGGVIRFEGLRTDSQTGRVRYRLTEVATTNGSTLLAGTAFDGYLPQNDAVDIQIQATNGAAFELPTSGSTELAVVQLIGAALIVLALIGFSATSFSSKLDQTEEKKKRSK